MLILARYLYPTLGAIGFVLRRVHFCSDARDGPSAIHFAAATQFIMLHLFFLFGDGASIRIVAEFSAANRSTSQLASALGNSDPA